MRKPVFPNTVVLFATNALALRTEAARTAALRLAAALPDPAARPEPAEG